MPARACLTLSAMMLLLGETAVAEPTTKTPQSQFRVERHQDRLDIFAGDVRIASYYRQHKAIERPFYAHLSTPEGIPVTRNFPPVAGKDAADHADMHPGLWLAFSRMNDTSFWHNDGTVQHKQFAEAPQVENNRLSFTTLSSYLPPEGSALAQQRTRHVFTRDPAGFRLDLDVTLTAAQELHLGVREEMGLGIRMATPLTVRDGSGQILASFGGRNEAGTWGREADWWDYFGVSGDRNVGVMLMSGPDNPPLWAHSRDYGLLVANPLPVDRPENRNKRIVVGEGESLSLRFGVLVHSLPSEASFDRRAAYQRYLENANP